MTSTHDDCKSKRKYKQLCAKDLSNGPRKIIRPLYRHSAANDVAIKTVTSPPSSEIIKRHKERKKRKRKTQEQQATSPADTGNATDHDVVDANDSPGITQHIASTFPFATDSDDHCETPAQAYRPIVPLLKTLGDRHVRIYDPYYCNGAVIRNLAQYGFANVYNRLEDCYRAWNVPSRYPTSDCLVTNPPYSGDHVERLVQHVTSPAYGNDKPWLLLLPQWVHKKPYWKQYTAAMAPFFVVPRDRYVYLPPPQFRPAGKKSDTHKKSSPFVTMWYIWGGTTARNEEWIQMCLHASCRDQEFDVARTKNALRDLRRKPR